MTRDGRGVSDRAQVVRRRRRACSASTSSSSPTSTRRSARRAPFSWPEAVEIVDSSFARFSPRLAEIFRACIDAGHVDVLPRPGKAGGAYCTSVSKTILPYVLMNYTERLRDVSTLAHEFGHATHNVIVARDADLAVAPHRHSDGGGAVDVRAGDRRRLPARERVATRARARRSRPTGSRTRSRRSTARRCSPASSSARTGCARTGARSQPSG